MKNQVRERRRRRRRRDMLSLAFLFSLLLLLLSAYSGLLYLEKQTLPHKEVVSAAFKKGDYIKLKTDSSLKLPKELVSVRDKIGQIKAYDSDKKAYLISFSTNDAPVRVEEAFLKSITPSHVFGEKIKLIQDGDVTGEGQITDIVIDEAGNILYEADFDKEGRYIEISDEEIAVRYQVPLIEKNTAAQNNQVLRDVMTKAKENTYTILDFPKGKFKIGSSNPDKDYVILSSNIEMNGHETSLIVEGTAYWFGLATGQDATEGLSQFTMRYLNFEAKDLSKGAHFMLMANHGSDWLIEENQFVQVHKSSSHLFDLGSVQNAIFQNNTFIGSAPDLTLVDKLPEDSLHPFISEVIQLDSSDNSGVWDANLIKAIDPNYMEHNAIKQLSSNIIITENQFLPYRDKNGAILANGGSIGQHSSGVGYVEITNNRFESPLVLRFPESASNWLLQPIHLPPETPAYIAGNIIE